MTWLAWRQLRAGAAMVAAALVVLGVVLALTGPSLADEYAEGIAACAGDGRPGCSDAAQQFFRDHQTVYLGITAVVLVLPALVGLFWGAPLIARELEAGTHRLAWNQSITRVRWLAVKLGLTVLAAMIAVGLGSLAVSWWASPIDDSGAEDFPRMAPVLFDARGIVPVGYAAFAVALGVTVGMLVRRTIPAMAITLAVFVGVQVAMPELVRRHLLPPTRSAIVFSEDTIDEFGRRPGGPLRVSAGPADKGAWVLSSHTVDASGQRVDALPASLSLGPCAPAPERDFTECLSEIERLGYRQQVTYHASSQFWPLQWAETGLYAALSLGLAGFCFWWLRRRLT
jgi:hypothetical protein